LALVLVALVLSLAGDVILMLPINGFVYGLAAFLLALLVYATAFIREGAPKAWHAVALVILGTGLLLTLRPLWKNLRHLRIPVAVYGAMSCATIVAALVRGNSVAIAGAVLFTVSDTLLAYARFSDHHVPYPFELGSYFVSQLLLAMSLET
ncbi:MAG: lysoplasmalogenase, partial [Clostridia bacterium]|nr:lysoplasmalogenase [Deltaproteobacteria bacterium]